MLTALAGLATALGEPAEQGVQVIAAVDGRVQGRATRPAGRRARARRGDHRTAAGLERPAGARADSPRRRRGGAARHGRAGGDARLRGLLAAHRREFQIIKPLASHRRRTTIRPWRIPIPQDQTGYEHSHSSWSSFATTPGHCTTILRRLPNSWTGNSSSAREHSSTHSIAYLYPPRTYPAPACGGSEVRERRPRVPLAICRSRPPPRITELRRNALLRITASSTRRSREHVNRPTPHTGSPPNTRGEQ